VRRSLAEAIGGAAAGGRVRLVAAGLAGVDFDGTGEGEARAILADAGYPECLVLGDMVIAHAGALGGRSGVVAAAGTGAVFLGQSPDGRWAKAGGWGYLFGDEGSAYWIGRTAVAAASKAHDGRGRATCLEDDICRRLGIRDFTEALGRLYGGGMDARGFASLSPVVDAAAGAGDAVAQEILDRAGEELAAGAEALVRRLAMTQRCEVSWQGAVLDRCLRVRERFCAVLRERLPGVTVVAPAREPVYGAWLLGCRALGW
jgi:N-acetylglucosamine kinase-like BadF-type ATPase